MSTRAAVTRYARALLDAVAATGNPEQVDQDLAAFARLIAGTPELQKVFSNPAVPVAAKRGIVEQLLVKSPVCAPVTKLLLLLAERDRLSVVPALADAYRHQLREYRRMVLAEFTTAAPLLPERVAELEQRLARALGRHVTLTTRVDPTLIGGAVARVGSVVYDSSVATQLARLRERLEEQR